MESVYHIVTVRVNETSWAHVWRLRSGYLGTGYDIGFAFDAFGQWSEHERNKMKWRIKVRIEWRPSKAGRPKIGDQPATFSLLSSFPLHYLPL
jgi:hypothetical protein